MLFYVVAFNLKHQHTNFTLGQYILIFLNIHPSFYIVYLVQPHK